MNVDKNFLLYTKAVVNITYLTVTSQMLGTQIDNMISLVNDKGRSLIVQLAEEISEKLVEIVEKYKEAKIPPEFFAIATLIVSHKVVNEAVELSVKSAELFAKEQLDLNIELGIKRGDINYER